MLIIVVYLLIASAAAVLFFRHLRVVGISISTTFHAYYLLYYFIIPPIALFLIDYTSILSPYVKRFQLIAQADDGKRWLALFFSIVGYLIYLAFFYKRIFSRKTDIRINIKNSIPHRKFKRSLFSMGIVFSVIGILCMLVVIADLGGVSSMLSVAADLRGYNVGKEGFFSGIGAMCLTLVPFIFGGAVCMLSCVKARRDAWIWLAADVVFIVLYLLFDQGRGPIIFFTVCVLYAYLKNKKMKESHVIGIFVVIVIFLILFSGSFRSLLRSISGGMAEDISFIDNINSIVNDFTYPYGNTLYATDIASKNGYRYFSDYYLWVVELLPSQILSSIGINLESITTLTDITSYFWSGGSKYLGGVPVDFITSGYMQAGIIGFVINSCVALLILKWLDSIISSLPYDCSAIRFWYCCTVTTATILSLDFCKLPLTYLYMYVFAFLLRNTLLHNGLHKPATRNRFRY